MSGRRRVAVWALGAFALVCFASGVLGLAASGSKAQAPPPGTAAPGDVTHGRQLFLTGCATCHGVDARGIRHRGPNLHGVGAQAADWYIRTGRMPLAHPTDYPVRAPSVYGRRDRRDLVAYVGSLGGPPIPDVHPDRGSLAEGKEVFTNSCAGCHQVAAQGGILTPDIIAPSLQNHVTARDVAEVIRFGPYAMPKFGSKTISAAEADSLSRYVLSTQHLENPGGWGLGNIGPIPEGMAAWGFGLLALIAIARLVGTRTEQ